MLSCISGAVGVSSKFSSFSVFFSLHMTSEGRFSNCRGYVRRFTDALAYTKTRTVTLRPPSFCLPPPLPLHQRRSRSCSNDTFLLARHCKTKPKCERNRSAVMSLWRCSSAAASVFAHLQVSHVRTQRAPLRPADPLTSCSLHTPPLRTGKY